MTSRTLLLFASMFTIWGCGNVAKGADAGLAPGTEGGPCLSNGTCNTGLTCASKTCVKLPDSGVPDLSKPDKGKPDRNQVDAKQPDHRFLEVGPIDLVPPVDLNYKEGILKDQQALDLQDSSPDKSDLPLPDQTPPDTMAPDKWSPDTMAPDLWPPDLPIPTKKLVDDTFAEFSKGTLAESGAKMYVSAKGNVQLVERFDLNNDGWSDVVFSNQGGQKSYIYWNSKGTFLSPATEFQVTGNFSNTVADLNDDGFAEVVFTNYASGTSYLINSYIYWGSASGPAKSIAPKELPTVGASGVSTADLNQDGYLDLVFSNTIKTDTNVSTNSYIYWGGNNGFTSKSKTELPTHGATGNKIADFDKNGYLDLVFCNSQIRNPNKSVLINSYVYWGSSAGFSKTNILELPTIGAHDVSTADLNQDGHLDLVFSNWGDPGHTPPSHNSYIYWGTKNGPTTSGRTELPTVGAICLSIANLNNDNYLDILFCNSGWNTGTNKNSIVYWGGKSGYLPTNNSVIDTVSKSSLVLDWNDDKHLDIALTDGYIPGNSYIYWGGGKTYSKANSTPFLTQWGSNSNRSDPGTIYSRKTIYNYSSRELDALESSPKYAYLSWKAKVPVHTKLRFQVRSASTKTGLATATWYGPTSANDHYVATTSTSPSPTTSTTETTAINKIHDGHRYIQYRATFEQGYNFTTTPVLDQVEIRYY